MKIAVSSATFAFAFSSGALTQLEWLDACANELEVDGVVLDVEDFPRTDGEYLAQIKKTATDLGLTIAAISRAHDLPDDAAFAVANALGAPIAVGAAPLASDDPGAWNAFVDAAKTCARAAKKANVVVALGSAPHTLCADGAALRRVSYDVDGSWLRYAFDPAVQRGDESAALLPKSVIAQTAIANLDTFATDDDAHARDVVASLARFRGFIVLASAGGEPVRSAYHDAIARFVRVRSRFLERHTIGVVKT